MKRHKLLALTLLGLALLANNFAISKTLAEDTTKVNSKVTPKTNQNVTTKDIAVTKAKSTTNVTQKVNQNVSAKDSAENKSKNTIKITQKIESKITPEVIAKKESNIKPVNSLEVPINFKIAVVDVQKVVDNSSEINKLKLARKNGLDDLQIFVLNAQKTLEKEKNRVKKKELEDSYNKELNERKQSIDENYSQKLLVIDKNITKMIESKAKKAGFNLILAKNEVLYGGTDITSEIIKELK
jgi:outer membrane protein